MSIENLEITDITIYPIKNPANNQPMSFVLFILGDNYIIHGIKIYQNAGKPFVNIPLSNNFTHSIPTLFENLRVRVEKAILEEYSVISSN